MKKPAPDTLTSRIRKLIAEGWSNPEIARKLGCHPDYPYTVRFRDTNPSRYKAWQSARRRRRGVKIRAEFLADLRARGQARKASRTEASARRFAERKKRAGERWAKVKALLDQGLSYGGAASKLGVTRNAVAGLKHRANGAEGCP